MLVAEVIAATRARLRPHHEAAFELVRFTPRLDLVRCDPEIDVLLGERARLEAGRQRVRLLALRVGADRDGAMAEVRGRVSELDVMVLSAERTDRASGGPLRMRTGRPDVDRPVR